MNNCKVSHLSDGALTRDLKVVVTQDCATTATLLVHLAEFDARRLYVPAGHPSMYAFCVGELHFSEDIAYKRIRAARAAREFPALLTAVAEGRLHLTAVAMLAPHLTPENADELLAAASHMTGPQLERLLAERFPRPDLPQRVEPLPPGGPWAAGVSAPGRMEAPALDGQLAARRVEPSAPARMETPAPAPVERPRVAPLSAERYALQVTIGKSAYEKLQYAQRLLGHQIPPGEIAPVLERALDALIAQLEKRKFAATSRPRPRRPHSSDHPRHIPAAVKRAVWQRDGGQCTFVSEGGRRCSERSALEFDHVQEVARGGRATEANLRLRCRAHNQYGAERIYGAAFMSHKREEAQRARAAARVGTAAEHAPEHVEVRAGQLAPERAEARTAGVHAPGRVEVRARAAVAAEQAVDRDVVPWLRRLGFRADEVRRAVEACDAFPEASLEERVRFSLSLLQPPHRQVAPAVAT